jgi:hypothetical protein
MPSGLIVDFLSPFSRNINGRSNIGARMAKKAAFAPARVQTSGCGGLQNCLDFGGRGGLKPEIRLGTGRAIRKRAWIFTSNPLIFCGAVVQLRRILFKLIGSSLEE